MSSTQSAILIPKNVLLNQVIHLEKQFTKNQKNAVFTAQSTQMRSFFDQHGDFNPQPPYIKWETSKFYIVYNLFRFVGWCDVTSRCHSEQRMTSNWAAGPREACHKHQSQEWSSPNKWEAAGKILGSNLCGKWWRKESLSKVWAAFCWNSKVFLMNYAMAYYIMVWY